MTTPLCRAFALAALALLAGAGRAAEPARAFLNARLLPIDGPEIARGALVVRGAKIVAVGPVDGVPIPADAEKIDLTGRVVMPGLICTHSHLGGIGAADGSGPIQPAVRISDSTNVLDSGFRRALAGGLTTLNVMPGSGHLCGGQTSYVKLRFFEGAPRTVEEIFLRDAAGNPLGGLKMANGTNSIKGAPFPGTRAKSAALVREQFLRAAEYQAKVAQAGGDAAKLPPRDLNLEVLAEVLARKRVVHHHTHRHDDILTVLRLAKEFNFRVVLHHVTEGHKVADELAKAKIPCSILLVDSPGGKVEMRYFQLENAKLLDQAGVRVAFHTDDHITDSRVFRRMAALGVRAGMSRKMALEALTLAGAEMLDLQDRLGTLTPGKDADFVVFDGDPLSVYSRVLETWVEGRKAFDLANPQDKLYAEGGYGAGHDQRPYLCCFETMRSQAQGQSQTQTQTQGQGGDQ